MKFHTIFKAMLGAVATLCASHAALAATITFDGLPGTTGDPFSTYSEAGFSISAAFGDWKEGHAFGAPPPSLYVEDLRSSPFGGLQVTGGGLFTFESFDLSAFSSAVGYEVTGWLGASSVFDVASSQAAGPFATVTAGSPMAIDRLTIDVSSGGPGSFNIDNIRVSAVSVVPEPSTYALMALGFGVMGMFVRRRRGSR